MVTENFGSYERKKALKKMERVEQFQALLNSKISAVHARVEIAPGQQLDQKHKNYAKV